MGQKIRETVSIMTNRNKRSVFFKTLGKQNEFSVHFVVEFLSSLSNPLNKYIALDHYPLGRMP